MTCNTVPVQSVVNNLPSNYLSLLDSAWQQHLAPRADNAPTVISTFAGCGGSSLGYSMAGYRELTAVELNDNAAATFALNFPDVPIYKGDIALLPVNQILATAQLEPGQLDVLDGSPPCQGFSTAGKRMIDDPRNQLFREYVRLIEGLQPKVFVMENVSGMVKGKMKLVFVEILTALKACGYRVSCRLLNAMYFNVPQSRQRVIFIGIRNDIGITPTHPKAQSRPRPATDATDAIAIKRGFGSINDIRRAKKYRSTDRPAPTIERDRPPIVHYGDPSNAREITVLESARLQSFPDQFQWIGKEAHERIGNSVPPLFMKAIAEHIRDTVLTPIRVQYD